MRLFISLWSPVEHGLAIFDHPSPIFHLGWLGRISQHSTMPKPIIFFLNGRMDKLTGYFDGNNYIQHKSQIADRLSGLGAALQGRWPRPVSR
jgi:hypothetical protein